MANFTEARVGTIDPSRALVLASILQNHKPVDYGIPAGICPTMDLSPKANETESSGRYCEVDLYKAKYYTTGTVIKKVNNFICYDPDIGRVYPVRGMVKAGTICKDLESYCQPVTIAKNIHGLKDGTRGPGGKVFVDTSVSINETTGFEVEGLASYHFNSQPYVSYENTNIINIVTGKIQAQGPVQKYTP
ncbi:Oidioi.mRNA.OKI2018_I69.chr2.g4111.t1.cds [Oikopleura dioica]|uniref:Oidioi.mRNA.OKI2018_I69.chr2.g4111.t1.cds n=1 Tax=Oikopleura dioica TaxID=34765 RepID=A0ABN7T0I7_OIKDI|nr:Oidioi.mRNA.OKI2018_I69.chr2.g4111.t1.cds [Oikopleura dioica]